MPELSISQVYYTYDHEWINFQGEFAYMGVCSFKLLGFRNIKDISFSDPVIGFKKKGTLLAVIKSAEYQIEAYMEALTKNLILVIPTGLGKTLIACLLM